MVRKKKVRMENLMGTLALTSSITDHLGFQLWEGSGVPQEPGDLTAREWLTSQYQARDGCP